MCSPLELEGGSPQRQCPCPLGGISRSVGLPCGRLPRTDAMACGDPIDPWRPNPSASSSDFLFDRDLLLQVLHLLAAVMFPDPGFDLVRRQQALGLHNGFLAVLPLRLDPVQPRTLARQPAGHDPDAPFAPDPSVVRLDPGPNLLADMPGGIVPDQQQRLLALLGHFLTNPSP